MCCAPTGPPHSLQSITMIDKTILSLPRQDCMAWAPLGEILVTRFTSNRFCNPRSSSPGQAEGSSKIE